MSFPEISALLHVVGAEKMIPSMSQLRVFRRVDEEIEQDLPSFIFFEQLYQGISEDYIFAATKLSELNQLIRSHAEQNKITTASPAIYIEGRSGGIARMAGQWLPRGWIRDAFAAGMSGDERFQLIADMKPDSYMIELTLDESIIGRALAKHPYFKALNRVGLFE